jgi:glycosyltransferase involved in cell wall biosynthesis
MTFSEVAVAPKIPEGMPPGRADTMVKLAVVAAVPLSLDVFMRPHLEAMVSHYAVTMISSAGRLAILDQLPKARFLSIDIRREISPLADLRALLGLFVFFRREKFTLVHSLTPKAGLLAMLAAFLCRVPVRVHIFTGQVWITRKGLSRSLLKALDRLIAALATHILADSPSQCRFLIAEGVVDKSRIQVLADGSICGVDLQRFRPDAVTCERIRQALLIPEGGRVILFLGRLTRDKGVLDLAQAFATLAADHQNLYLMIVGPDEEGLRSQIEALLSSCSDQVRYVGMTNSPEEYMTAADIFALPSYREGFGSVILEAAACGVPAVASRIYGLTDAVAEGETGLLHEAGSVEGIASALRELATDERLCRQMGGAARERALTKYSVQRLVAAQMAFYQTILGAPSGGTTDGSD